MDVFSLYRVVAAGRTSFPCKIHQTMIPMIRRSFLDIQGSFLDFPSLLATPGFPAFPWVPASLVCIRISIPFFGFFSCLCFPPRSSAFLLPSLLLLKEHHKLLLCFGWCLKLLQGLASRHPNSSGKVSYSYSNPQHPTPLSTNVPDYVVSDWRISKHCRISKQYYDTQQSSVGPCA